MEHEEEIADGPNHSNRKVKASVSPLCSSVCVRASGYFAATERGYDSVGCQSRGDRDCKVTDSL